MRDQRLAVRADLQVVEAEPAREHVLYAQLADRYVLVEREGPPPPAGTVLELTDISEHALVVDGIGPSPLPADLRRCAFAYFVPAAAGDEAEAAA